MRSPTHVSQVTTSQELREKQFGPLPWLWDGYLTPFAISLMTSHWKAGKTTLLSALIAKMAAGGEFAGSGLRAGRVLIVTEEDQRIWSRRQMRFEFGDHVNWVFRPFAGPPTVDAWLAFMKHIRGRQQYRPVDLLVIDPLATMFPPAADRNPETLLTALAPLRTLASRGVAVLLLHHPRKGRRSEFIEPRGTGVLPSTVDIIDAVGAGGKCDADGSSPLVAGAIALRRNTERTAHRVQCRGNRLRRLESDRCP